MDAGHDGPKITMTAATTGASAALRLPRELGSEAAAPATPALRRALCWALEGPGWVALRPALDALALLLAVAAGVRWAAADAGAALSSSAFVLVPLTVALLAGRGMYRRRLAGSILDDLLRVVSGVSIAVMLLVVGRVLLADGSVAAAPLAHLYVLALAGAGTSRVVALTAQRAARRHGLVGRRALVVGAGVVGERIVRRLLERPEYGLTPIGYLDYDPPSLEDRSLPVLGSPSDLDWIAQLTDAEHVVLAFSSTSDRAFVPVLRRCEELGLSISVVPRLFDALNDRASYETLGGLPILGLDLTDPRGVPFQVKHLLDRAIAGTALTVLAPALLAVAAAVRLSSPGPVLFRQRRVGRDGRAFDLLKFRSMAQPDDDEVEFVPADGTAPGGIEGVDRRTAVGRFLRRTSLDELPQLINVLRGEMSLVGPRPERPEFVERFREDVERYGERHRVRAGITGWAQVNGLRGQTSIADRAEWDNYYIEHWSLWLDVKILLLTVAAVFRQAE